MSNTEHDAALLRLVKERSESKKSRTLLENDLSLAGNAFCSIGEALRKMNDRNFITTFTPDYVLKEIAKAPEICGLSTIKEKLIEFKELQASLAEFDRRAAELGVD